MSETAAFSRRGALAVAAAGFALLLAVLWLIGAGADFGGDRGGGQAHAASNGLNGYAGLVRLTEAQGYTIERTRTRQGLETDGLLVLTPTVYADPEEFAAILENRKFRGPTLVILPKWLATTPPPSLPAEARARFRRGWVMLGGAAYADWPEALPAPFTFRHRLAAVEEGAAPAQWAGLGHAGTLPAPQMLHAEVEGEHETLVTDAGGRLLAFTVTPIEGSGEDAEEGYPVAFLAEPDLANNYGLADPARAAAVIALVDDLTYDGEIGEVIFDMTLNGYGASENLLTLAFRPPFLAATLSLLVALLIVGWRAFRRFGPPAAAAGPDIAFGKRQLILNGAGLILRARRFGLLATPYAALSARRLADRLGLARPDPQAIDAALARRLPAEEPFTRRAARLEAAAKPAEILAAAQSLDELATKLAQGQTSA